MSPYDDLQIKEFSSWNGSVWTDLHQAIGSTGVSCLVLQIMNTLQFLVKNHNYHPGRSIQTCQSMDLNLAWKYEMPFCELWRIRLKWQSSGLFIKSSWVFYWKTYCSIDKKVYNHAAITHSYEFILIIVLSIIDQLLFPRRISRNYEERNQRLTFKNL